VAEQVSVQWVMDAHRADTTEGTRQEDIAQPTDGVERGSKEDVTPPPTEPNVAQLEDKQPLPSLVEPVADADGEPQ